MTNKALLCTSRFHHIYIFSADQIDVKHFRREMSSYEYWLISAPGDKTCQQTFDKLNQATSKQQLSTNWKFHVPDLKVGTLDQLVGLSDDLGKLDTFVEQITRSASHQTLTSKTINI